jgi:hypothetical protein
MYFVIGSCYQQVDQLIDSVYFYWFPYDLCVATDTEVVCASRLPWFGENSTRGE